MVLTFGLLAAGWLCWRTNRPGARIRAVARAAFDWARSRPAQPLGLLIGSLLFLGFIVRAPFGSTTVNLKYDFVVIPWRAIAGTVLLVALAAVLLGLLPLVWQRGSLRARGLPFWCSVGLFAFVLLSFGPVIRHRRSELSLGPYALLYRYFPGYRTMRVPARFCALWQPLLLVLAAWAGGRLWSGPAGQLAAASPNAMAEEAAGSSQRAMRLRRVWLCFAAVALLACDLATGPMHWVKLPKGEEVPPVFRWLRDHGEPGAVVILPVSAPFHAVNPPYLFYSLTHRRPLLNGYPAFTPLECREALMLAERIPAQRSISMLRRRGIRYIVLDAPMLRLTKGKEQYESLYRRCCRSPDMKLVTDCPDMDRPLFELRG